MRALYDLAFPYPERVAIADMEWQEPLTDLIDLINAD
jgi:hypothetical protein